MGDACGGVAFDEGEIEGAVEHGAGEAEHLVGGGGVGLEFLLELEEVCPGEGGEGEGADCGRDVGGPEVLVEGGGGGFPAGAGGPCGIEGPEFGGGDGAGGGGVGVVSGGELGGEGEGFLAGGIDAEDRKDAEGAAGGAAVGGGALIVPDAAACRVDENVEAGGLRIPEREGCVGWQRCAEDGAFGEALAATFHGGGSML